MSSRPHRCPVCNGSGQVPPGFYYEYGTLTVGMQSCRACAGSGVIWETVEYAIAPPTIVPLPDSGTTTLAPPEITWQAGGSGDRGVSE